MSFIIHYLEKYNHIQKKRIVKINYSFFHNFPIQRKPLGTASWISFYPLSLEDPRRDFPQRNYNLKENKHFSVWTCIKSNCSWDGKPVSTFGSPVCSMTDYSQHVYQKMLLAKIKVHLHILLVSFLSVFKFQVYL